VVSIWLLSSPSLMWSFFIGRATAEIYTLSLHDALPIFGLESSGNVLGVLSDVLKLETSAEGERLLFGVPYLQFAKTEIDYRWYRSEEHTSELQSRENLVCRLLLEKKNNKRRCSRST